MPLNKLMRLREPQKREVVHTVRDKFLEEYKKNPDLFYEDDVQEVIDMKFLLQRAIISKRKDVDDSFKCLVEMLKFRKEQRVREISNLDVPIEYQMCGACFHYEKDKYGNKTLYIRTSVLRLIPELRASFKQFLTHQVFTIDNNPENQPWACIFDLTNTGWNNYDIDLMMYFLTLVRDYFPVNVDYVLLVNFPWILTAVWTLAKRFIPPERRDVIMFISSKEIFNYVDEEHLPDFLNGTCKREYKLAPEKCQATTVGYLLEQNPPLPAKRIREIIKTFSDIVPQEQVDRMYKQLELSGRK